jgi:CheY-like chemotaxis protein
MDMRMPVMDGYEATRRIKASDAGRDIPIVAVTASAFGDSEVDVLQAGVCAYIRKPYRIEEIFGILAHLLNIEYMYAEDPTQVPACPEATKLSRESAIALPAELREAMREAVANGDMAQFSELIGQADAIDAAAAHALRTLAERYEYEKLNELLTLGGDENA